VIKTHWHSSDGPLMRYSFPAAEGSPVILGTRKRTFYNDGFVSS
jgi:hypothetical protein